MTTFWWVMLLALGLGWPLGHYMARVMRGDRAPLDAVFLPVERGLYKLLGPSAHGGMNWRGFVMAFLFANAVLFVLVWILFMVQGALPLNPDAAPGMTWDLALHTVVSFLTNTNQQHYSGQAQLSYLSQMVGIVGLQMITPMFGLAMLAATLRGLFGGREAIESTSISGTQVAGIEGNERDVGNFWRDVIRGGLRILLPLCLLWSMLLTWQGVPSTLQRGADIVPIDATAGMANQHIPVGPVAAMVAVKQLGTNGGGWYGPNGTVALENPTPFSNLLETLALILIPVGCAFMVGKEMRFGADASAAYAALTSQTSNGSVIAMHDSLAPLAGGIAITNMLVNAIWGGIGCGVLGLLVYMLLALFLAGLMTGRTPELFGRKIEVREVRWLALLILIQPLAILGFTAITLAVPSLAGISNPGAHGVSQVLYEYTSAFANNGSGFEGLADNTVWWNVTCAIVLLLGRIPVLVVPLTIAGSMARKRVAPEGPGTLQIESPTFALTLAAVIGILTVLQFMPALVLGPIADHLQLAAQAAASGG